MKPSRLISLPRHISLKGCSQNWMSSLPKALHKPKTIQLNCLGMEDQRLICHPVSLEQATRVSIWITLPSSSRVSIRRLYFHMGFLWAANNVQPGLNIALGKFPNMLEIWNTLQGAIVMTPQKNALDNHVRPTWDHVWVCLIYHCQVVFPSIGSQVFDDFWKPMGIFRLATQLDRLSCLWTFAHDLSSQSADQKG